MRSSSADHGTLSIKIPAASSAGVFVFREIHENELRPELFSSFIRRQIVHDCWRRSGSSWEIRPDPFIDDWTCDDILELLHKLRKIISAGGLVYGAFSSGCLKGFAAVDSRLFGSSSQYADLAELHVSEEARRLGVGSALFCKAAAFALGVGARKLYISSHSAVESVAFYLAMGCREAEELEPMHVAKEPYDRQLEYVLK